MASDDEAGPSEKRIKLDSPDPIMDVRAMNKLFPKIDNLEHFPLKVLMNIFTRLDYMDLYNLAEESSRFERIVKIVLNEKYSNEYFIVDEYKHNQETYIEIFERFGSDIKAIDVRNVKKINGDDFWITSLLDKTNNLQKLSLERIPFHYKNNGIFQHVNENLTHLICRHCNNCAIGFSELPKFHNLKKLEIQNCSGMDYDTLAEAIHNNPALESLVLGGKCMRMGGTSLGMLDTFGPLVQLIGTHLEQLKELEYICNMQLVLSMQIAQLSNDVIEKFVVSLKNLESFGLSANVRRYTDFNELLRRLSSECKSIKHLKLYDIDGDDTELFDVIRSFEKIESLALAYINFGNKIESLVEHLPFLRELNVTMHTDDVDWSFVLVLLRKCTTLEKLTITGDPDDDGMEMFGRSEFRNNFIKSIQNLNVKLEVEFNGQRIGSISKDEVIWRNKLVHWVGYDPDLNSSNINLLDLTKETLSAAAFENPEQSSPFDLILGYLDLNSLYSFSRTSKKCLKLVNNHVKQYSQHRGSFTITNEFNRNRNGFSGHYDGLEMFAKYVIDLKVDIFHQNIVDIEYLLESFHNLNRLHVYTEVDVGPHHLIVPQVRHLIYNGTGVTDFYDLKALSSLCPDLETLEFKRADYGNFHKEGDRLNFHNLKTFILKYHEEVHDHVEDLEKTFKGTKTELFLRIGM